MIIFHDVSYRKEFKIQGRFCGAERQEVPEDRYHNLGL